MNEMDVQTFSRVRTVWFTHFAVGLGVVMLGMSNNEDGRTKFIPIDPLKLQGSHSCQKAYINVHSSSMSDDGAFICCGDFADASPIDNLYRASQQIMDYFSGPSEIALCTVKPTVLPLINHLTRFPHSWLMVLLPLLLRMVLSPIISRGCKEDEHHIRPQHSIRVLLQRMLCYILLMLFRGYGLYELFDYVENISISPISSNDNCWYHRLLPSRLQLAGQCYGLQFDFSDHIVFFFAHLLPLITFEALLCFAVPFWHQSRFFALRVLVPVILFMSTLYIQAITLLAAHRTAKYFHTSGEVIIGYMISLLVQIPLTLILCTDSARWETVRTFIGLPTKSKQI
mmetsp:Transcript_7947/g.11777  ORF Transcript_7947/g.11777 Transcript_7947/m.11777 type:complete len:341 (-) Transcript_7947:168-1190(-)